MEIRRIRTLRGPNIWSRKVALEAWVDLGALKDTPSDAVPGFVDRLMAYLPGMIEHRCSVGERGGFLQRLRDGTYPAHILEHTTLELQTMAGTPVGFGKARETHEEGVYRVVVRYKEEQLARAALHVARDLLMALYEGRAFDLAPEVARLKELKEDVGLGPSTAAIVAAAEARGIPTRRLNAGSLVQLGHGARQHRIWTAETDATSALAENIAQDKELTKQLLRTGGVPVPSGRAVTSADDAWEAAQEIGLPVVVKPRDGNHGRGVYVNLSTETLVREAFVGAAKEGTGVIVETFAPGNEHRLLVVGGKLVAAARGEAAFVVGDGRSDLRALVEAQLNSDPRRGDSHDSPLAKIEYDEPTLVVLASQGLNPESIPEAGASVLIQRNGNLRIDCTDEVHPSTAAHLSMAARIVGLDITGIDVVAQDISKPLEEQGGVVVEMNSSPGLHAHLMPGVGKPRPVGEAIVETLFPEGETGRIPIVGVTGTNGKTIVSALVAHLLRSVGRSVGLTTSDGVWVNGRQIERGDCSGPRSARRVLLNPQVDAAVFEAGRGGILREGLGFDKCDVAIVTNLGEGDHFGRSNVESLEEMFTVKRCPVDVVLPSGAAILKADDPFTADMARLSDGAVIFFAIDSQNELLASHRAEGKRAIFVRDGSIVFAIGADETVIAPLSAVPITGGGRAAFQVENALAAAAAGLWLGLTPEQVRTGLASFRPEQAPGRFQRFEHKGATIVLDDARNVSAILALGAALNGWPARSRSIVYSGGAARRDADVTRQGEILAQLFDRVVAYEDSSADDRAEGELTALLRKGLEGGDKRPELLEIADHRTAVETALRLVRAGDVVVVQTEDSGVEAAVELVRAIVGTDPAKTV